jgi:hypothetical protein
MADQPPQALCLKATRGVLSVLRVICVTIEQSYNRGCTIAQWLRRSLFRVCQCSQPCTSQRPAVGRSVGRGAQFGISSGPFPPRPGTEPYFPRARKRETRRVVCAANWNIYIIIIKTEPTSWTNDRHQGVRAVNRTAYVSHEHGPQNRVCTPYNRSGTGRRRWIEGIGSTQ